MTWLKGTSTWANICDDLTKLAAGEIADGSSVTCAVGDQWIREIAGQNLLRSPASSDYALPNMSNRAGYFSLATYVGAASNTSNLYTYQKSVCRQTAVWSGTPSVIVGTRWALVVSITVANTVAGNYSNLQYQAQIIDLESLIGNRFAPVATAVTKNPSAAGTDTVTINTRTIGLAFSDPSGIIPVSTVWIRSFSTTYLGGFDSFGPMFSRRSGAPTFSVSPPGVAGTDYDVTEQVSNLLNASCISGYTGIAFMRGGNLSGLGIKTNTALTGALYTCTWNVAYHKIRLVPQASTLNGQIFLEWQGNIVNDGTGTYRLSGGLTTQWLRPYQTPGSVTEGSLIQYWMSITPTKIVVVLNANPGETGKLTCAMVGAYTPSISTIDVIPAMVSQSPPLNYTADNSNEGIFYAQGTLYGWKLHQDGSEGRDWQTGYMRGDLGLRSSGSDTFSEVSLGGGVQFNFTDAQLTTMYMPGFPGTASITTELNTTQQFASNKPSGIDNKWWLYGFELTEVAMLTAIQYPSEAYPRGYIDEANAPILWVPGFAWSSGDELTDTVTGKVYFLIAADYQGISMRYRYTSSQWNGGIAILEE